MEIITETIAAGAVKRFERAGRYVEIIEATGRLNIELTGPNGDLADDMRQAMSGFYSEEKFSGMTIENPETFQQTIRLMLSNGRGGSRRQPGTVRVVDQSAEKTLGGQQFYGSVRSNAGAGVVSFVGLHANGANVAVRAIVMQSNTAGEVMLGWGTGQGTALASSFTVPNKNIGGATGTVRRCTGNATSAAPSGAELPGYVDNSRFYISANAPFLIEFKEPIIISGTQVMTVNGQVVNRMIDAVWVGEEL